MRRVTMFLTVKTRKAKKVNQIQYDSDDSYLLSAKFCEDKTNVESSLTFLNSKQTTFTLTTKVTDVSNTLSKRKMLTMFGTRQSKLSTVTFKSERIMFCVTHNKCLNL